MTEVFAREQVETNGLLWSDVVRHGLATPLAVARGCVDHLRDETSALSEAERRRLFQALDRAVSTLERLSRNLRSDVRLERAGLRHDFQEISVHELLRDAITDLADVAAQREVQLLSKAESDPTRRLHASPLLVRQALENLVTNAIKHSPRRATVEVACREEDDWLYFEVTDHGDGVPASALAQIFDRFGGIDAATGGFAGLGIGLSIVKRVAEAHGGHVGVFSEIGEGSTFWIRFPLTP